MKVTGEMILDQAVKQNWKWLGKVYQQNKTTFFTEMLDGLDAKYPHDYQSKYEAMGDILISIEKTEKAVEAPRFKRETESDKPKITLSGSSGNAYSIIAKVVQALERAGMEAEKAEFLERKEEVDYDGLLQLAMKYCDVS